MAKVQDKTEDSAEKAYAAAAAEAKPAVPAPAAKAAPATKRPAPKSTPAPVAAVAVTATAELPPEAAAPIEISPPTPTISELKDKIMATAKTTEFAQPVAEAIGQFQTKAKAAYDKSTETLAEATEFAKGNVEALVESGKIFAAGAQDLGKGYVEEAKSAYETLTADLKEMAAIKSPTELFQLQGKIMRRNFDALVATSSKNTEAALKLANDAFAPITGRVNLAAEKLATVA